LPSALLIAKFEKPFAQKIFVFVNLGSEFLNHLALLVGTKYSTLPVYISFCAHHFTKKTLI
jgi:hypothetical protein